MEEQSIRKTYKYKLKPTPEQAQVLDRTLMRCRHVYNAAVGERREAWQKCGVSVTYSQQQAELPEMKSENAGIRRGERAGIAGRGAAGRPGVPSLFPPGAGG